MDDESLAGYLRIPIQSGKGTRTWRPSPRRRMRGNTGEKGGRSHTSLWSATICGIFFMFSSIFFSLQRERVE